MYSALLRSILMAYLATSMSTCDAMRKLSINSGQELISSVIALSIFAVLTYFPYYAI